MQLYIRPNNILGCIWLFVFTSMFLQTTLTYQWLEFNDYFDCIVGIKVYNRPISIGVYISKVSILTSANPLQPYWKEHVEAINTFSIDEYFNKSKTENVISIAGNQSYRDRAWVNVGFNSSHSTIHDIMIVNNFDKDPNITYNLRHSYPVFLPSENYAPNFGAGWHFAGFGYVDKEHVKNNTVLEMSYFEELAQTDCDEWLPREWGRFICFRDVENLAGVASGAPLFHGSNMKMVIGIGSFSLTKNRETILSSFYRFKTLFKKILWLRWAYLVCWITYKEKIPYY